MTTKTYTVTFSDFAGGLGTSINPYLVSNAEQLNNVRKHMVKNVYFKQTADIDLTDYLAVDGDGHNGGKGWAPIGNSGTPFKGKYDGGNKSILGLSITSTENNQGLFGYTDEFTQLKNINLMGVTINGASHVGALVGYHPNGLIEKCTVTGNVTGTGNHVGGLIGYKNSGEIKSCGFDGNVIGVEYVGGLTGRHNYLTISASYATGSVKGSRIVGGLIGNLGANDGANIINCYSLASVTGTADSVGGLIGMSYKTITNSYAAGLVTGTGTSVGGLVGNNTGTVIGSYYDSVTTLQSDTGKGDGKTTEDMKKASTFSGWDTDIWNITNDSYPTLK